MKKITLLISSFYLAFATLHAQQWDSVGSSQKELHNNPLILYALTSYQGNLIGAGKLGFGATAGPYIAQLVGNKWNSVMDSLHGPQNCSEFALQVYNNNLFVGGQNNMAGNYLAYHIAQWNGYRWDTVGPRFQLNGTTVWAMTTYNNNLLEGGLFQYHSNAIMQWNGSVWSALGPSIKGNINNINMPPNIDAMVVYNGNLIIGGIFDSAGNIPAKNIAQWNGTSWSALGSGLNSAVNAITVYNGNLIVAGFFDSAGGVPAKNIAQWDGTSWSALCNGAPRNIYTLTVANGVLVAGGLFDSAGSVKANNVAQWGGIAWDSVGAGIKTTSGVCILTMCNGFLYAGGTQFKFPGNNSYFAAARFNGLLGIPGISKEINATVYPNPGSGKFNFSFTGLQGNGNKIEVYNMLGEKIYTALLPGYNPCKIDLSGKPSGIYLYRINNNLGQPVTSGKLVIE